MGPLSSASEVYMHTWVHRSTQGCDTHKYTLRTKRQRDSIANYFMQFSRSHHTTAGRTTKSWYVEFTQLHNVAIINMRQRYSISSMLPRTHTHTHTRARAHARTPLWRRGCDKSGYVDLKLVMTRQPY